MSWRHHTVAQADDTVHVWPEADVAPHEVDLGACARCWCDPEVSTTAAGLLRVTHRDRLDRLELDFDPDA